jgi:hypothetical protein
MNPAYLIWQAEHRDDSLNTTARADSRAELAIALSLGPRRRRSRAASLVSFARRAFGLVLAVPSSRRGPRPRSAAADGMEMC